MHAFEIAINLWLQGLGEWLKTPMLFFSFLGTQNAYMVMMACLYWCIDSELGFHVALTLLLSNGVTTALKWAFKTPRPYWINSSVKALATESSFGIPSGHTLISTSFWGEIAIRRKKLWLWAFVILLVFLIGLSRIYLGVHFLSDVIAGWLFGGCILILLELLKEPILKWVDKKSILVKIELAFISSLILLIILFVIKTTSANWTIPDQWITTSQITAPGSVIDPIKTSDIFLISGSWMGFLSGVIWINVIGGFDSGGKIIIRLVRFIAGMIGLIVIAFGLTGLIPNDESLLSFVFLYLQYFLISLWVAAIAPLLFLKLGLTKKNK
jgi:membrane-associated phospholipid phosphatase